MTNRIRALVVSTFLLVSTMDLTAQEKGFLSILKVGQSVGLKEASGRYEVTIFDGIPQGYKVIQVGQDFVVVEDVSGITELHIPIYSIKCITKLKVKR